MTISAAIYGLAGLALSSDERAFFSRIQPFGYILFTRNCETPQQVRTLVGELQALHPGREVCVFIDQEGGRVARLKPPQWPVFPPAGQFAKLARVHPQAAQRACYLNARLMAQELTALGIRANCAPVADLCISGAHDIIGDRAFGEDPEQVAMLARAQAQGLLDGGVLPVLKHIPGHGRAKTDSHESLPVVETELEVLQATDFVPFKELRDLPMAMTAHVIYSAIDAKRVATCSPKIISMIRRDLGFDGLLMSDDLSMKALSGTYADRAVAALAAGCDVVLHCNGNMNEMAQIAGAAPKLAGKALKRAEAALAMLTAPKPLDAGAAREEIEALVA